MIRILALCTLGDLALLLLARAIVSNASLWFALAHLVLTVGALLGCLLRSKQSKMRTLVLPIGAVMGPCGMLLLVLVAPHFIRLQRKRQLTYRAIRTRRHSGPRTITPTERVARILDERVRYPEPEEVGSLAGMLHYGSLQARYKALETAVTSFEPRLSSLIVMALSDEDQTIRALAAAAAAQISYNLAQQRRELEAKIAPTQNLDDRYSLALLLADHGCHNQLLPKAQRARLCQEASAQLRDVGRLLPIQDIRQRTLRTVRSQVEMEIAHHTGAAAAPVRVAALEVAS